MVQQQPNANPVVVRGRVALALILLALLCLCLAIGLPLLVGRDQTPGTRVGAWNRFEQQSNVVECTSASELPARATLTVHDQRGEPLATTELRFAAKATIHYLLDPVTQADSYGTYVLNHLDGELAISCTTLFYRLANDTAQFSYSLPLLGPYSGTMFGLFNSFNPSSSPIPISNWLAIFNPGATSFSVDVLLYDQTGKLEQTVAILNISPFGRYDLALGHPNGQRVGLFEIRPRNPAQPFSAYLARFAQELDPNGAVNTVTAYSILPLAGSGKHSSVGTSTMADAINWIELGNTSDSTLEVEVRLFSQVGSVLARRYFELLPRTQQHLYANEVLGPDAIGKAEVFCRSSNCTETSLLVQSLFYGFHDQHLRGQHLRGQNLRWAYASQGLPSDSGKHQPLQFPVTTFLGAANWLKLSSPVLGAQVLFGAYDASGHRLQTQASLNIQGTLDLPLHEIFGPDAFGSVGLAPTQAALAGELIRVFPGATRGQIGHINPIRSVLEYDRALELARGTPTPTPTPTPPPTPTASPTPTPTPSQNSFCRVQAPECPRNPSRAGIRHERTDDIAISSAACLTHAPNLRDWCGSSQAVTTKFYLDGIKTHKRVAKPAGCLITLEECRTDPTRAGTFYDFVDGSKVTLQNCPARPLHYRNWCQSHRPVVASFYTEGVVSGTWSAAGLAPSAEFANELRESAFTPILHEPNYRQERTLYRYVPKFTAGPLGFSPDNHVLLLNSNGYLSKLDAAGSWRAINLPNQVRAGLQAQGIAWDGKFNASSLSDHRIVFDASGDAYLLFDTTSSSDLKAGVLVHSRDQGETWKPYVLPTWKAGHGARLEFRDGHNQITGPPPILVQAGRSYLINTETNRLRCTNANPCPVPNPLYTTARLLLPSKAASGTLTIGDEILLSGDTLFSGPHSGAGNSMATLNGKTHIVYPKLNDIPRSQGTASPCVTGTPQYIVTYDRNAATKLGSPVFLGCGGAKDKHRTNAPPPDNHNIPAISIDSKGYLHAVLGTHHDQFVYRRSTRPNDSTSWTNPKLIGEAKRDPNANWSVNPDAFESSYTYVSLLCDKNDMLHIVARWGGMTYRARLVYLRKSALSDPGSDWHTFSDSYSQSFYPALTRGVLPANHRYQHQHLVVPFQVGYVVYHHKLDLDRYGRLFLSYRTWYQQLTAPVAAAYCSKWSAECPSGTLTPDAGQTGCDTGGCWYQDATQPKDPSLLISVDGGNTWRLATSQDLLGGIVPD